MPKPKTDLLAYRAASEVIELRQASLQLLEALKKKHATTNHIHGKQLLEMLLPFFEHVVGYAIAADADIATHADARVEASEEAEAGLRFEDAEAMLSLIDEIMPLFTAIGDLGNVPSPQALGILRERAVESRKLVLALREVIEELAQDPDELNEDEIENLSDEDEDDVDEDLYGDWEDEENPDAPLLDEPEGEQK